MRLYFSVRIAVQISLTAMFLTSGTAITTAQTNSGSAVKFVNGQVAAHTTTPATVGEARSTPSSASELNKADLAAFMDGMIPVQLDRSDVAGAAVFVVQNNDVLLFEGLRLRGHEKAIPCRCKPYRVPAGIDLQAIHVDIRDATCRTRKD